MKITLLTRLIDNNQETFDHANVGDCFIGHGLQYIIEKAIHPEPVEWVLMSRWEPFTKDQIELMKTCDYIIYGGMPQYNNFEEWKFFYDDEIWDYLNYVGVPILRLAGGGGYPSESITPDEFAEYLNKSILNKIILEKACKNTKLITTRDKMAQRYLETNNVKSTLLPCTGTFACMYHGIFNTDNQYNAINITTEYIKDRLDNEQLITEFKDTKKFIEDFTQKPCKFFAQVNAGDYEYTKEQFGECVRFNNIKEMMDFYSHVDICITSRLHTALPIHGIGGRTVLLRVDTRGIAGEELEIPVIPLSNYKSSSIIEIIKNNMFSKQNVTETINKSVEFYKNFFAK